MTRLFCPLGIMGKKNAIAPK